MRCLILIFLMGPPLYGISQVAEPHSCDELIFYRDQVLAKDFFKAFDTYRLSADAKNDIDRISASLLSDKAAWYEPFSSENAASDWSLLWSELWLVWGNLSKKYGAILKMANPLTGESEAVAKSTEYWYKLLETGQTIAKVVTGESEQEAYKLALAQGGELSKAIADGTELLESISGVNEYKKLEEEHGGLKAELKRILALIHSKYERFDEAMKAAAMDQSRISHIVLGIDKYLAEKKCRATQPTPSEKPAPAKIAPQQPSTNDVSPTGDGFYMFLVVKMSVKPAPGQFSALEDPKSLYIISSPIWHAGKPMDDMEPEKERFKEDIQRTFASDQHMLQQFLSVKEGLSPDCITHAPGVNNALKTKDDAKKAISSYMNNIRETLEGLASFDFLQVQ